jgi:iron-sulfur cluster repair protein YtfE (RIC family)
MTHLRRKPMATQKLPGTTAARNGAGDADLTIMIAAHNAFRRDLDTLARAAKEASRGGPDRQRSVAAGWELFKRQLHLHHTAEDVLVWPALRARLTGSPDAQSVLDEMAAEHALIDPLLAAVDAGFAAAAGPDADPGQVADAVDALATSLTGHLSHEEKDGLPLIGVALTVREWRGVGFQIVRRNGLSAGGEMFAWILSSGPDDAPAIMRQLPPPARVLYKAVWKPRFDKTARW